VRKSGRSAIVVEIEKKRGVKTEESPREHEGFSHFIASSSTVFCSTGTILRRKGNGDGQKHGRVKTRTLENHEDAAPKPVPTVSLSATRLIGILSLISRTPARGK
jgi:hypothetical protein